MDQTLRATRVRYFMIAVTTSVAVMLYVDRVCISILQEQIKPLLAGTADLQKMRFDDLMSAFFWTYALFQLPAGWLGDRYGPRVMLSIYLFAWSACTALMGMANGFALLFVLRLGCGMFEAGAYPLAAGIVKKWMPFATRGLASGCVAVGGRLGGAITSPMTLFIAGGTVDGWRQPFFVYGLIGMVGAVAFVFWFRNLPDQHPLVNEAEAKLIQGDSPVSSHEPVRFPPLRGFIESRALWLNSLVQFMANFAWVFIVTQFPSYLEEVFQTPKETRAWYQFYPLFAGIFGMLLGGWLSDVLVKRFGLRWGRALPVAGSRLIVGAAYLACLVLPNPIAVTIMMCLVAMATDMGVAPVWAYSQDVGGKYVGAVIGWANMWGNFGAALAPMLLGRIRLGFEDPMTGWNAAFLVCACTQVVAALAALGIDSSRQLRGTDR